jgi:hypothetical protein
MEERSGYVVYRAKRIWYLAHKLASASYSQANRYLEYDPVKQEFSEGARCARKDEFHGSGA